MIIIKLLGIYICLARINIHSGGGRYYATGKTRLEAVSNVIDRYNDDLFRQII